MAVRFSCRQGPLGLQHRHGDQTEQGCGTGCAKPFLVLAFLLLLITRTIILIPSGTRPNRAEGYELVRVQLLERY
jgi:hypothetical protein